MILSLRFKIIIATALMATISATAVGGISVYSYYKAELANVAQKQEENIRTAAEVFQQLMPELNIKINYDANKHVDKISFDNVPAFSDHDAIDRVGRITGQTVTILHGMRKVKIFGAGQPILSKMMVAGPWEHSLVKPARRMTLSARE